MDQLFQCATYQLFCEKNLIQNAYDLMQLMNSELSRGILEKKQGDFMITYYYQRQSRIKQFNKISDEMISNIYKYRNYTYMMQNNFDKIMQQITNFSSLDEIQEEKHIKDSPDIGIMFKCLELDWIKRNNCSKQMCLNINSQGSEACNDQNSSLAQENNLNDDQTQVKQFFYPKTIIFNLPLFLIQENLNQDSTNSFELINRNQKEFLKKYDLISLSTTNNTTSNNQLQDNVDPHSQRQIINQMNLQSSQNKIDYFKEFKKMLDIEDLQPNYLEEISKQSVFHQLLSSEQMKIISLYEKSLQKCRLQVNQSKKQKKQKENDQIITEVSQNQETPQKKKRGGYRRRKQIIDSNQVTQIEQGEQVQINTENLNNSNDIKGMDNEESQDQNQNDNKDENQMIAEEQIQQNNIEKIDNENEKSDLDQKKDAPANQEIPIEVAQNQKDQTTQDADNNQKNTHQQENKKERQLGLQTDHVEIEQADLEKLSEQIGKVIFQIGSEKIDTLRSFNDMFELCESIINQQQNSIQDVSSQKNAHFDSSTLPQFEKYEMELSQINNNDQQFGDQQDVMSQKQKNKDCQQHKIDEEIKQNQNKNLSYENENHKMDEEFENYDFEENIDCGQIQYHEDNLQSQQNYQNDQIDFEEFEFEYKENDNNQQNQTINNGQIDLNLRIQEQTPNEQQNTQNNTQVEEQLNDFQKQREDQINLQEQIEKNQTHQTINQIKQEQQINLTQQQEINRNNNYQEIELDQEDNQTLLSLIKRTQEIKQQQNQQQTKDKVSTDVKEKDVSQCSHIPESSSSQKTSPVMIRITDLFDLSPQKKENKTKLKNQQDEDYNPKKKSPSKVKSPQKIQKEKKKKKIGKKFKELTQEEIDIIKKSNKKEASSLAKKFGMSYQTMRKVIQKVQEKQDS